MKIFNLSMRHVLCLRTVFVIPFKQVIFIGINLKNFQSNVFLRLPSFDAKFYNNVIARTMCQLK